MKHLLSRSILRPVPVRAGKACASKNLSEQSEYKSLLACFVTPHWLLMATGSWRSCRSSFWKAVVSEAAKQNIKTQGSKEKRNKLLSELIDVRLETWVIQVASGVANTTTATGNWLPSLEVHVNPLFDNLQSSKFMQKHPQTLNGSFLGDHFIFQFFQYFNHPATMLHHDPRPWLGECRVGWEPPTLQRQAFGAGGVPSRWRNMRKHWSARPAGLFFLTTHLGWVNMCKCEINSSGIPISLTVFLCLFHFSQHGRENCVRKIPQYLHWNLSELGLNICTNTFCTRTFRKLTFSTRTFRNLTLWSAPEPHPGSSPKPSWISPRLCTKTYLFCTLQNLARNLVLKLHRIALGASLG